LRIIAIGQPKKQLCVFAFFDRPLYNFADRTHRITACAKIAHLHFVFYLCQLLPKLFNGLVAIEKHFFVKDSIEQTKHKRGMDTKAFAMAGFSKIPEIRFKCKYPIHAFLIIAQKYKNRRTKHTQKGNINSKKMNVMLIIRNLQGNLTLYLKCISKITDSAKIKIPRIIHYWTTITASTAGSITIALVVTLKAE